MARLARIVLPGVPHHVTHRGNRRQAILLEDQDRFFYLRALAGYLAKAQTELWAFCLMTNHVHLIVVPHGEQGLARGVGLAHRRFAQRQNAVHGWTGHLFENRFFSTPLDGVHLWAAVRYVERNPVRAGMVGQGGEWPWSSARAHLGEAFPDGVPEGLLSAARPFPGPVTDWRAFLTEPGDAELVARLRRRTRTGRPCGADGWVRQWQERLGVRLLPRKRGRKPRTPDEAGQVELDLGEE